MNLGQVSPEIAEGFGAHRSSSTSSRDAADGAPHGAARGKAGLFDDLVDALAADERRAADDDPAEQTADGGIVPFQLPLMPQDASPAAPSGDAAAKAAASDQAPASAAESAIADAIDSAVQAQASNAQTAAALPTATKARESAAPVQQEKSHAERTERTQTRHPQTQTQKQTQAQTASAVDTASAPSSNAATPPDDALTDAPAASGNPAASADAAPSGTQRSEHAQRRDAKGRTTSRAATHHATEPVSKSATDSPHTVPTATVAMSQSSGTPAIHVSRAHVRLMNAQMPAGATDSVHISAPSVDAAPDAVPSQTETAAASDEPASVNSAKAASPPTALQQTPETLAQNVPAPVAAGETGSTADAATVTRREAASGAIPVEATLSESDASGQTKSEPPTGPQEPVALPPNVTGATAKPLRATPPSAHAERKQRADSTEQTAAVPRGVVNQSAAKQAGERSVATTDAQPAQVEDVPSQGSATKPPTNQSAQGERPVRTAEAPPAPARELAQARIDVQARPETAQRLLERAIASQQPAEASRGANAAGESPALAAETSTGAPGQAAADQSSTGGQQPHEQSRDRQWASATPIDRMSATVRRTSDSREADVAAPVTANAASRGATVLHTTAPLVMSPQLAEVVATPTASATSTSSMLAPDTADRIVQSMRLQYQRGGGDAVLQIRPEHLGPVTISLRVENGVVSAVVSADHPATAEWLQSNQQSLKESLQQSGLQLERFVVQRDGQSPSDRQRREWIDARRRDVRRRAPQQDSTFEITM